MKPLDTCSVKYCFSPSSLLSFLLFSDSFSSSFPFLFFPRIFRHVIIYTSITDPDYSGSHRVAFTLIRFSLRSLIFLPFSFFFVVLFFFSFFVFYLVAVHGLLDFNASYYRVRDYCFPNERRNL